MTGLWSGPTAARHARGTALPPLRRASFETSEERDAKAGLREKQQELSCKTVVKTCCWNAVCRKSEQTKRLA